MFTHESAFFAPEPLMPILNTPPNHIQSVALWAPLMTSYFCHFRTCNYPSIKILYMISPTGFGHITHNADPCPPQSGFARGYKKSSLSELSCFLRSLAEREGFEPPEPFSSTVFKTAVIDHSTTSPIFHKAGKPPYRVLFPKRTAKIIKNLVFANYFCFSRLLSFRSPSLSGFLSSTRKNLYWNAIR